MKKEEIEQLISIIIPSRDIDYLLETSVSKIRALYKNVQIILVLDKINTENTYIDSNLKIIKSENKNISAKRNLGVKNSTTKYIAFIDSDVFPNDNWLENAINFLEKNENYSAVTGTQYNFPEDNFEQQCLRLVRFNKLFTHKEWCLVIDKNAKEQDYTQLITSNAIIKKDVYDKLNGMKENIYLAEDNEFSKRLINNDYKIRFIPEVSVFHRECTLYPFLRKLYCMSFYYSNTLIKGEPVKSTKEYVSQFLPIFGIFSFFAFWYILKTFNINPQYLLIFPLLIFSILIKEAIKESQKLKENKIKGFFFILFSFCLFCTVVIFGSLYGLLNLPTKDIKDCYKHY